MPKPGLSPDSLRREADGLDAEAARLRRQAELLQEEAARRRALAADLSPGLSSYRNESTMTSTVMEEKDLSNEDRRRLGIAKARGSDHAFPQALYERGSTVTAWARDHKLDRNIVKSWFAKGSACRPIPRKYADEIQKTLGVPATDQTWRAGIR